MARLFQPPFMIITFFYIVTSFSILFWPSPLSARALPVSGSVFENEQAEDHEAGKGQSRNIDYNPTGGRQKSADEVPYAPQKASEARLSRGINLHEYSFNLEDTRLAFSGFLRSCDRAAIRVDHSGLTQPSDWAETCQLAKQWPQDAEPSAFFINHFDTVRVGEGRTFVTGYFEPEIEVAHQPDARYRFPIFGKPHDLLSVPLADFRSDLAGETIVGRLENNRLTPYFTRAEIENGALQGRADIIAWAADEADLFFLHVQGSGTLQFPDGMVRKIGFAAHNGHPYTGIGRLMAERGLLASGQSNMAGIKQWLRDHPAEGRAIMLENPRFIFFRSLNVSAPLGAMGVPVTPRLTVAADPAFVPLGAPVLLNVAHHVANGIWIAQDKGGAIKGANRFDTFWGRGEEASFIAGGMASRGEAWILLPKVSVERLLGPSPIAVNVAADDVNIGGGWSTGP